VFYAVEGLAAYEEPQLSFGRAAIAAYVEGTEGRLMRSMKSILGSTLADQATDVGGGRTVRYLDVVGAYLRRLKALAERDAGGPLTHVVLGRPVFFVDDDPARDQSAQKALEQAARAVGFTDISFQFEPIAAALDFETTIDHEQIVLVADIGGGTSDFSLVRVGPQQRQRADRRADILANHGVHVAGTDFDRHIELAHILPTCGYRGVGPTGREVPRKVYFDLATWHLINTVYLPNRLIELRQMASLYVDQRLHRRLMTVLECRLGHALAAMAEAAKIDVSMHGAARIDLSMVEDALAGSFDAVRQQAALSESICRIAGAARQAIEQAGLSPSKIDALYFTGGSTALQSLANAIGAVVPDAAQVDGDRFTSVVSGLAVDATRRFG